MTNKKQNILFVACAFGLSWVLILILLVLTGALSTSGDDFILFIRYIVYIFGSWAPTIALLVLFRVLFPGSTIRDFYKNAFKPRLNLKIILSLAVVYILIVIGGVSIIAFSKKVSLISMFDFSPQTMAMAFVLSLVIGAAGEESGWRGFLQQSVEKSFGVIKSSVIVGAIWVVWHLPIRLFVEGLGVQYLITISIGTMCLAIIIGICYSRCRNLFIPIWAHFISNFVLSLFSGDDVDNVNAFVWFALLSVLAAAGYIIWYKRTDRISGNIYI